jgi:hypothetical protein
MDETNLLSLIRPWLDKYLTNNNEKSYNSVLQKFLHLNQP